MKKIFYYKKKNGSKPVKEFIDSLDEKFSMKIFWVFKLVKESEDKTIIPKEYFKKLTSDIWEIRAKVGTNAFRLLCFFDGQKIIITTNGFKKKTKKTPKQEIKLAEQRRVEYYERKRNHG